MKKTPSLSLLRILSLAVLLAGAGISLGLMLHTGRSNRSVLLLILFTGWVLSPFIALLIANVIARRWSDSPRRALYYFILILTLGSLVGYSGVLSPAGTKPAAVFLFVPLLSWLLIAIVIPVAASWSRRLSAGSHKAGTV